MSQAGSTIYNLKKNKNIKKNKQEKEKRKKGDGERNVSKKNLLPFSKETQKTTKPPFSSQPSHVHKMAGYENFVHYNSANMDRRNGYN